VIEELPHDCPRMRRAVYDDKCPLVYWGKFREFGIRLVGQEAIDGIDYCPWCGMKLPASLRDQYFDYLDELGLDPGSPDLPIDLRTGAWWRVRQIT
jgi:hypothetical protein